MEWKLTAILAADVVGYSRLMGEDETGTLAAPKAYRNETIDPRFAEHGGRIVKPWATVRWSSFLEHLPTLRFRIICAEHPTRNRPTWSAGSKACAGPGCRSGLATQKWRAPTETGGVLWDEESGLRRSSSARRCAWC